MKKISLRIILENLKSRTNGVTECFDHLISYCVLGSEPLPGLAFEFIQF